MSQTYVLVASSWVEAYIFSRMNPTQAKHGGNANQQTDPLGSTLRRFQKMSQKLTFQLYFLVRETFDDKQFFSCINKESVSWRLIIS